MACLDMYNSEHNNNGSSSHHHHHHHHNFSPSMSPRISFSNDFVDAQQAIKQEIIRGSRSDNNNNNAPEVVSSDFEFSVTNYSMMSADELFFKGRFLPFKDNFNNNNNQMQRVTTTLREELLVGDDDDDEYYDGYSLRPPKGSSTKWKGFLGLRKSSNIGSKKVDKSEGSSYRGVESRRSGLINEGARLNVNPQQLLNEGDSSYTDVEIGI